MQNSHCKIELVVSDPVSYTEYAGAKQYFSYTILGTDGEGQFKVQRRYPDCEYLRTIFCMRWPGCFIPALPGKNKIMPTSLDLSLIRKKYLEYFLTEIAQINHLWYSDEMQLFLRNPINDCTKIMQHLNNQDLSNLLYRFEKHFSNQIKSLNESNCEARIAAFCLELKVNLNKTVHELKIRIEALYQSQSKYKQRFGLLQNGILTYEKNVLSFYGRKTLGILSHEEVQECTAIMEQQLENNPFFDLFSTIKHESKQLFCAQQTIDQYYRMERDRQKLSLKIKQSQHRISQIKSGKESLLSKMKGMSKQQQIEQAQIVIVNLQKQLQQVEKTCRYCKGILGGVQIQRFKESRKKHYYWLLKEVSKNQLDLAKGDRLYWKAILTVNQKFDMSRKQDYIQQRDSQDIKEFLELENNEKKLMKKKSVQEFIDQKQTQNKIIDQCRRDETEKSQHGELQATKSGSEKIAHSQKIQHYESHEEKKILVSEKVEKNEIKQSSFDEKELEIENVAESKKENQNVPQEIGQEAFFEIQDTI